jgi:hypothetical protein
VFRLVDVGECLKRARRQDLRRKRSRVRPVSMLEAIYQEWRDFKKKPTVLLIMFGVLFLS